MGENLPFSIARAEAVLGQVAGGLQRRVGEYFREHFYLTTSGYFTIPPILCAREVLGNDRIMISIDYPYSGLENGRLMLDELSDGFTDAEIEGFAWRNVSKLLRL